MPDIVRAAGIRLVQAQVKGAIGAGVGQAGMAW